MPRCLYGGGRAGQVRFPLPTVQTSVKLRKIVEQYRSSLSLDVKSLNLVSYLILKPFFQQCRWVLYSLTVLHPKLKETVYGIFAYIKLNIIVFSFSSQYYQGLNLPEEELKKRLKHCSRHRARFSPPPSTPPGFWNLSFPDTQEYMDKGYLKTASEVPAPKRLRRTRRNRIAK